MLDAVRRLYGSSRRLTRHPALAVGIVLILAVSIASATTVASLRQSFYERLPLPQARQLVAVYTGSERGIVYGRSSLPDATDYAALDDVFAGLAVEASFGGTLGDGGETDWIWGRTVSGDYFDTLQLRMGAGRGFLPEEAVRGGPRALVLSHALWQRRFGGDPAVVGRTVRLNEAAFSVVGIAPPQFVGTNSYFHPDAWVPLWNQDLLSPARDESRDDRDARAYSAIGRLAPGVHVEQAQEALTILAGGLDERYPSDRGGRRPLVTAATWTPPSAREAYSPTVRVLGIAVAVLVGIGLVNVITLVLARMVARRHELATRLALGGSRGSAIADTAAELLPAVALGALVGLALSRVAQRSIAGYFAPVAAGDLGDAPILRTDATVLATAALIALVVVLAASTVPVLLVARRRLSLVPGRDRVQSGRAPGLTALVIAQIAASTILLCLGGLLARSMDKILDTDPGYPLAPFLLTHVTQQTAGYPPAEGLLAWQRVRGEMLALPGISQVTMAAVPPLAGWALGDTVRPGDRSAEPIDVDAAVVDVHYLSTLGLTLTDGRWFDSSDTAESRPVGVVNRSLAQRLGDGPPVGQVLYPAGDAALGVEVVGVVEDTRYLSLAEPPWPLLYYPHTQRYQTEMTLVSRVDVPPETLIPEARRAVQAADAYSAPIYSISLVDFLEGSIWEQRLRSRVLLAFACAALVTAMVGLFALMRFRTTQRRPEIGLRLALGASPRKIRRQVVGRAATLAILGVLLGLPLSWLASRAVASFFYGVAPGDPLTLLVVTVLLIAAAVIACWLPARQASRVDPAQTLRRI